MDECPHCGEPIDDDAESCRHCGSDFEAGWKPDTDYGALDLPDDDFDSSGELQQQGHAAGWEAFAGPLFVTAGGAAFAGVGWHEYQATVVPFALILFVSLVVFLRLLTPRKRTLA